MPRDVLLVRSLSLVLLLSTSIAFMTHLQNSSTPLFLKVKEEQDKDNDDDEDIQGFLSRRCQDEQDRLGLLMTSIKSMEEKRSMELNEEKMTRQDKKQQVSVEKDEEEEAVKNDSSSNRSVTVIHDIDNGIDDKNESDEKGLDDAEKLIEACEEVMGVGGNGAEKGMELAGDLIGVRMKQTLVPLSSSSSLSGSNGRMLKRALELMDKLEKAEEMMNLKGNRTFRERYGAEIRRVRLAVVERKKEQIRKAMQVTRRALRDAPMIAFASSLSVLTGALDASRHYYEGECLSLAIAAASQKKPDLSVWGRTVRALLVTQVLCAVASVAKEQASRLGRKRFVQALKTDLFAALIKQDFEYFESSDLWEVRHLIGSADNTCALLLSLPTTTMEGVARVASSAALLVRRSPFMALLMMLALPLKRAMELALDRLQRRLEAGSQSLLVLLHPDAATADVWQSLVSPDAMKTMRAFAREPTEIREFSQAMRLKDKAEERGAVAYQLLSPARDLLDHLLEVLGIWYGGRLVGANSMRAADLPTFVSLATDAYDRARFLATFVGEAQDQVLDPIENMYDLLSRVPRIGVDVPSYDSMPLDDFKFSVEFEHVEFAYPTRKEARILQGVSFQVKAGQRVGIMGQSGCGKSTLFSLLLRLYDVNKGCIKIGGRPIQELNPLWLRERIAFVSQSLHMPRRTIKGNLVYGKYRFRNNKTNHNDDDNNVARLTEDEEIAHALRLAQCSFFMDDLTRFPHGIHTDIGLNGSKLSGGERQRLAIARALLIRPRPKLLLLDEHTSALDEHSQRAVQLALDELWQESGGSLTIISIAHRLSNFRGMDSVIIMDQGVVAEQGAPRELLATSPNGLFAGYVESSLVDFTT